MFDLIIKHCISIRCFLVLFVFCLFNTYLLSIHLSGTRVGASDVMVHRTEWYLQL